MLPVLSDRDARWPSHPAASRDPLLEASMWVVEGLVHRYPTKVLLELTTTCPQYCGHCTRMDLVGRSTSEVAKTTFSGRRNDRYAAAIAYLEAHTEVRDIVLSGGDVANVSWPILESLVSRIMEIESIRHIRLASKSLVALPQYWSQSAVLEGLERLSTIARSRGVEIALHTHANSAQQVTLSVVNATRSVLDTGIRNVRNQGVILRGTNDSAPQLLDLCWALYDGARIVPYYFYMCDLIPNSEHWRVSLGEAQGLAEGIWGDLPGFATPHVVCDVPGIGKRWVHQNVSYDRERGISLWTEQSPPGTYYDPLRVLPASGLSYWEERASQVVRTGQRRKGRRIVAAGCVAGVVLTSAARQGGVAVTNLEDGSRTASSDTKRINNTGHTLSLRRTGVGSFQNGEQRVVLRLPQIAPGASGASLV
jgi:lysine 2,3-aminomutase